MNIKDFFNKEIKRNICSQDELNGKHSLMAPVDWRNPDYVYYEFYTDEQIKYLFDNGLLQVYKKTGANWERPHNVYFEFTDRGRRLRIWYNSSLWYLFKAYVIKTWWWRHKWQDFRIACGHHYDWQDYEGTDDYCF